MKTLNELIKSLERRNIKVVYDFGISASIWIYAQVRDELSNVDEVKTMLKEGNYEIRASKWGDGPWITSLEKKHVPDEYDYDRHWEMDAYEYDGDPDKFDEWREGGGD